MDNPERTPSEASMFFRYERDLQSSIRRQLHLVEEGLVAADGGVERKVATGKIDILARDLAGNYVVIELKAGPCPKGAIEQVLGYTHDIETETGKPCRSVVVAHEFSKRIQAAAERVPTCYLVTYESEYVHPLVLLPRD